MHLKSKDLLLAAVGAVSLVLASHVMAAPIPTTWTGTAGDSLWTDAGNWSAGVPQTGYAADFTGTGNGDTNISLGGTAQAVNTVAFSGTPAAYTIGTTAGDVLTFDSGGTISLGSGISTTETIAAGMNINAAGGITVTNSGTGTLALTGNITGGTAGVIAITIPSGTASGPGNILFSGDNTYVGDTTITSTKTIDVEVGSDNAFGTGTFISNTTSANPVLAYGGNHTISNAMTLITGITFGTDGTSNLTFAGPITQNAVQNRTVTFLNYGTVVYLGASKDSSTLTLNTNASATGFNLAFTTAAGTIPGSNPSVSGGSIVVLNDVIQDGSASHPGSISFNPVSSGTENEGAVIINGDSTFSGGTNFVTQTAGTTPLTMEIGTSSIVNGGSIVSGPFGTGSISFTNPNEPAVLEPRGADQTIANAITLTNGFYVGSAPTTGSGILVDPAGTVHNLYLTGTITNDGGRTLGNNMQPGAALYLGTATTSSTISMTGTTTFLGQSTAAGAGTTMVYDQLSGTGGFTAKVSAAGDTATVYIMNSTNNNTGNTSVIGTGALGSGATLGGTGMISGPLTVSSTTAASQGGIISPGVAGVGTLNVASMVLDPLGRYAFDYNGASDTAGSGVNDLISGSGTLDLTNLSSAAPFDLDLNPAVAGTGATAYVLADFAGGIINTGAAYANGTDVTSLFTFSGTAPFTPDVMVVGDGNGGQELELTAMNVPEPASLGLVGLGAIGMMKRRRK